MSLSDATTHEAGEAAMRMIRRESMRRLVDAHWNAASAEVKAEAAVIFWQRWLDETRSNAKEVWT